MLSYINRSRHNSRVQDAPTPPSEADHSDSETSCHSEESNQSNHSDYSNHSAHSGRDARLSSTKYDSDNDSRASHASNDSYDSNVDYQCDLKERVDFSSDDDRESTQIRYNNANDNGNGYLHYDRNRKQMEARKNFLNMSKKQVITAVEVGCNIKNIYWPSHRWLYWKFMSTKRLADNLHEERDRLFYEQRHLESALDTKQAEYDQYDYKIESLSRRIRKLEQIEHSAAAILCEFYRYSSKVVPCYSRCLLQSENGEYAYGHILIDIRSHMTDTSSSESSSPSCSPRSDHNSVRSDDDKSVQH